MGNRAFCSTGVCPKGDPGDNDLFDDTSACNPAGAIFPETLEDLNEMDRLLLIFAQTPNLAAIRWLFVLGANVDACDTNGSTALHAACRSGSLQVVQELTASTLPIDAVDVAGWTPLHVAMFMGRRAVVVHLLQKGAEGSCRNIKGLTPSDLSSDVLLREMITSCAAHRKAHGTSQTWEHRQSAEELKDIKISSRLRFEPFFVPRAPVMKDVGSVSVLQQLGLEIFNQRPGQGLAFLVSTGTVRDFPVELSTFLTEHGVSPKQVGEFLGEDFSLAQTLRLEYINSVRLIGTGVVSCLAKVCKQFTLPTDMHKIDRIIDGVAQIWWRQHEHFSLKDADKGGEEEGDEVEGLRLMKQIGSYDVLHQLMFSAIMLHWNLYAPLPPSQRVTPEKWLEINEGMGVSGSSGPDREHAATTMRYVQGLVYNIISHTFFPQLQVWSTTTLSKTPSSAEPAEQEETQDLKVEASSGPEPRQGWVQLVGAGLPAFVGTSGTLTYRHIRSIMSETTSAASTLATPSTSRLSRGEPPPSGSLPPAFELPDLSFGQKGSWPRGGQGSRGQPISSMSTAGQDWVWVTLRHGFLFLSSKPKPWVPYAFLHLAGVCLETDRRGNRFRLQAIPFAEDPRSPVRRLASQDQPGGAEKLVARLQLVFLLPDGRWQVVDVEHLEVRVLDESSLDLWSTAFTLHAREAVNPSQGKKVPRPPENSTSST